MELAETVLDISPKNDLRFNNSRPKVMLEWTNITFEADVVGTDRSVNTRHILKGINGRIYPGELTAIMGSSGAGKTSLLNILSARTLLAADSQ